MLHDTLQLSPTQRRGLLKLMVRLPALRRALQILGAQPGLHGVLFSAYDQATSMLANLRLAPDEPDDRLIREYEAACAALETEIIHRCLEFHTNLSPVVSET
jgi:hypothetical protein